MLAYQLDESLLYLALSPLLSVHWESSKVAPTAPAGQGQSYKELTAPLTRKNDILRILICTAFIPSDYRRNGNNYQPRGLYESAPNRWRRWQQVQSTTKVMGGKESARLAIDAD